MSFIDLFNRKEYAKRSTALNRRLICNSCPHQIKKIKQCSVCLCFTNFKTLLKNEYCPENFWVEEDGVIKH